MKRILIKNSVYGLIQAIINLLLILFVVPIFIKRLGSELYGIFALIMVVGNLNTFTNLGLTSALVKFVAQQKKSKESDIDITVNLLLSIILSLPLTLLAIYFDKFIMIKILNLNYNQYENAKVFYTFLLLANFVLFIGQTFKSILDALQRIYITSLQQIIYNILYWGLIFFVLMSGYSLTEIGISIFTAALIWFISTVYFSFKEYGKFSIVGKKEDLIYSAKKQINYGIKIYASGLIGFFYEPLTKILISNFLGVTEVGFYDIALKLKSQVWGFISKIFYPLFPFLAEQTDKKVIHKYVHDLEQKMFFLVIPIIVMCILIMPNFLRLWIGDNSEIISVASIIIISFHLIGSSTVIPNYQFLLAKNLAQKTIILQLSNVIFNAVFFLITVNFLGFYAVIVGNVAAILSSFILSLYYQKKYLDSLIFDSFLQIIKLIGAFLFLIIVGYLIKSTLNGKDVAVLIILPFVVAFGALFSYKVMGLINLEDIQRYFGNNNIISKILVKIYD